MKRFWKATVSLILTILMLFTAIGSQSQVWATSDDEEGDVMPSQPQITLPSLEEVECLAYCAYDSTTGEILISSNENGRVYPASMTKILTASLAIDYLEMDDMLTYSENAANNITFDSTVMGLTVGEITSVSELLYGLMLPSGNDAANALAEGIVDALFEDYPIGSDDVGPDGVNAQDIVDLVNAGLETPITAEEVLADYKLTAYAELANIRLANLGCVNSHYTNPHGLHSDNHYTTAYDLTLMMADAATREEFVTVINTPTHFFEATNINQEDGWLIARNSNYILSDPWLTTMTAEGEDTHCAAVVGGKTGTTSAAGTGMTLYTINENGHGVIVAVCGISNYSYQTRYVASIAGYGNLECWNRNPVSVLEGTTSDYYSNNTTEQEAPVLDMWNAISAMNGDANIDNQSGATSGGIFEVIDVPENNEEDESQAEALTESEGSDESDESEVSDDADSSEDDKYADLHPILQFALKNLAISIILLVVLVLILVCIVLLIIRAINVIKKKRRRNKKGIRKYHGEIINYDDFKNDSKK